MSTTQHARGWRASIGRSLRLDQPCLIGILNVTPDSFSDGGSYPSVEDAVNAALRMIDEGAMVIDVGGESSRPGSEAVGEGEQIRRTVPVIRALRSHHGAQQRWISIDTTRATVASAALEVGADIINDVSAGLDDPAILPLAAERRAGIVLMHRLCSPRDDVFSTDYTREPVYAGGVFASVRTFLQERVEAAIAAGVHREAIVIDPGLGFGKSVAHNYELAARLGELQCEMGLPALSAASRKSFLAHPPGSRTSQPSLAPRERLAAGIALTLSNWGAGVRLFRVHDVAAHARALQTAAALAREQFRDFDG